MTDPRDELRAVVGQWLRVRAAVRALTARLAAAEYAMQRDARRSDDPALALLALQLSEERRAVDALAADLDARIADVRRDLSAQEAAFAAALVTAAQRHACASIRSSRARVNGT